MATETAERLYDALEPFTVGDVDRGSPLLIFCDVLTAPVVQRVHEIVSDTDEGPGWAIVFDPDRCPPYALPYLAQFVGAELEPSLSVAEQRDKIRQAESFARGRLPAIVAATKRTLTGSKAVLITERYNGSAWQLHVRTLVSETADPSATEAAIRSQKPGGIVLTYQTVTSQSWDDLIATHATWSDVSANYTSWDEVRSDPPPA